MVVSTGKQFQLEFTRVNLLDAVVELPSSMRLDVAHSSQCVVVYQLTSTLPHSNQLIDCWGLIRNECTTNL